MYALPPNSLLCSALIGPPYVQLWPQFDVQARESKAQLSELPNFTNKAGVATHYFCPACGLQLFWRGFGGGAIGVNVRNFDGMKLEEISWNKVDGRSL